MLTIARRENQSMMINGNVLVTIGDVSKGGKVKLLIDAPANVTVDRLEVHEDKQSWLRILDKHPIVDEAERIALSVPSFPRFGV